MEYTYVSYIVSDLHKDARGYRPSMSFMETWTESSPDIKQSIWDSLLEELDRRNTEEKEQEELCIKEFHKNISSAMDLGAKDSNQAIRWLVESREIDTMDKGYICYCLGLPYSMEQLFIDAFKQENV